VCRDADRLEIIGRIELGAEAAPGGVLEDAVTSRNRDAGSRNVITWPTPIIPLLAISPSPFLDSLRDDFGP
jgi:hypothetical protein